ncbi:response regulator receiver protein [Rubellimicrobium mesophilum DSM 19309]|uniref:Response regulator receiver protein n=2 Tax=Rubellimicrobium TaxID=295418 RepID=A0A017HI98_9RHOB|nr:response regulator receiver protein [Rubellimicrobium mesophilum DSM 19309]
MTSSLGVRDHRVFLTEDELLLAEDLRGELERQEADVTGPLGTVADALEFLRMEPAPCLAVFDISLQDEMVCPMADVPRAQDVTFIFATGSDAQAIPPTNADVPRAGTPVELKHLVGTSGPDGAV